MRISVVICTHTEDRLPALRNAVESVLEQTHTAHELIIVSDGNPTLAQRLQEEYGDHSDVRVRLQATNQGLLATRNTGASLAHGDVVAFLDDDAVADPDWLAELARVYREQSRPDAYFEYDYPLAVGGKMTPEWVAGKPSFLPEEFYWLIGVTHRGFAEGPCEVRNTPGSNLSFRTEVFAELDGFDTAVGGREGDKQLQGGETELCARLRNRYGVGVYYTPDAKVAHKVFGYRTNSVWLIKRAFWQGYSKRGMETFVPESTGAETDFLRQLIGRFVPSRLFGLFRRPSVTALSQLVMVFVLTAAVGIGYGYGVLSWRSG